MLMVDGPQPVFGSRYDKIIVLVGWSVLWQRIRKWLHYIKNLENDCVLAGFMTYELKGKSL
jgi:hypothetical protein